ncbi:pilin [Candidatus Parcubacteria bacterium]|nr:pilin [Candidatus Parcubacteria bacterium]
MVQNIINYKLFKQRFLAFVLALFAGVALAGVLPPEVLAQAKTENVQLAQAGSDYRFKDDQKRAQTAAEEFCGKGDGPLRRACRQGYRAGYAGGKNKQQACDSSQYNQAQKTRCARGYDAGRAKSGAGSGSSSGPGRKGDYICGTYGDPDRNVRTKFDFGCLGTAFAKSPGSFPASSKNLSPILDFAYAIIRFLSVGVGIAITIAMILAGIQYSASEGNAEASTKAKKHIQSAVAGLVLYIFAWSILQFLIPGGVFK